MQTQPIILQNRIYQINHAQKEKKIVDKNNYYKIHCYNGQVVK